MPLNAKNELINCRSLETNLKFCKMFWDYQMKKNKKTETRFEHSAKTFKASAAEYKKYQFQAPRAIREEIMKSEVESGKNTYIPLNKLPKNIKKQIEKFNLKFVEKFGNWKNDATAWNNQENINSIYFIKPKESTDNIADPLIGVKATDEPQFKATAND